MNSSPIHLMDSISMAKTIMATLHDRAAKTDGIDDRCELSVFCTTVRKMEELLDFASEYEDILLRQLARTNARLARSTSPW